ncbi:hypothetical protein FPRO04_08054 [Fusarium proliferatum]|nr:hypothetical protein FPRO03_12920 [Fusarium proliferatum]KAG4275935.1 hypothetical protein FPRO04_08054 [Fusarium proliferatum]CVK87459.1 uncharacterized protein FPRN_05582 [Fusarium proliferatum]
MPSDSENSGSEISGSGISDSWHKFDDLADRYDLLSLSWDDLGEPPKEPESPTAGTEEKQESHGTDTEEQHAMPSEEAQAQGFSDDITQIRACAVFIQCRCMPHPPSEPSKYYLLRVHPDLNHSVDLFNAFPSLHDTDSVEEKVRFRLDIQHTLRSVANNPSYDSKHFYCSRAVGEGVHGTLAARNS